MESTQNKNGMLRDDLAEIKRKLVWRMTTAGLMIVALLGGLALFDHYAKRAPDAEALAPQFDAPVPVAKKTPTQPVTPVETEVETGKEAPGPALPVEETKAVEPPPKPEVAATPMLPRGGGRAPAVPLRTAKPAERVVEESRGAQPVAAPTPAAEKSESVSPLPARLAARPAPAPLPTIAHGYTLQAGVFSEPQRAEELLAKLTAAGIPASIQSRVQVGPFKNRAEAESARAKLKGLGIESIMQSPREGKGR